MVPTAMTLSHCTRAGSQLAKKDSMDPAATTPSAAASLEAVSLVFGNDVLLRDILLRLGFATTLVRAALVSKRWLRHAADPAFLCRFRERHPPRLLGFYVHEYIMAKLRFLPVSQDLEVRSAVRRASAAVDCLSLVECQNGRLLVRFYNKPNGFAVLSPLQATPGMAVLPPPPGMAGLPPPPGMAVGAPPPCLHCQQVFMPNDGGRNGGILAVDVLAVGVIARAGVHALLPGGVWELVHDRDTAVTVLPEPVSGIREMLRPIDGKIYIVAEKGCKFIIGFDLVAGRFIPVLPLPDAVTTTKDNFRLSRGENGSGLLLVHAEGHLLSVWRHKTNNHC